MGGVFSEEGDRLIVTEEKLMAKFPELLNEMSKYEKPEKYLKYGTAGFRDVAGILSSAMQRMGMIAALRSIKLKGQAVGVMVTASHNPESDNGVKVIDADGKMLVESWEKYAEALVNADTAQIPGVLAQLCTDQQINLDSNITPRCFLGRDTRMHSRHYADLVREGVELLPGAWVLDLGQMTTPIMHFVCLKTNEEGLRGGEWFEEDGYYNALGGGYVELLQTLPEDEEHSHLHMEHFLDAANGIGGLKIQHMWMWLQEKALDSGIETFQLEVFNNVGDGPLNHQCGSDFVLTTKQPPANLPLPKTQLLGKRLMSVDGDGDRGIFSYFTPQGQFRVLDGDKWAVLVSTFLKETLEAADLASKFTLGVVQTAYSNGATIKYFEDHGIPTAITKTGVKYLHAKAETFDVGVYCEPNGHGTVLFSKMLQKHLAEMVTWGLDAGKTTAAQRLMAVHNCVNPAVGDACSMLLLSDGVLAIKAMDYDGWDAMYEELPSRLAKLEVEDKGAVATSEDQSQVVAPVELQGELDDLMKAYPQGRCFVRPSGTENVVRVYAEAETQRAADALALAAVQAVHARCGGVGRRPAKLEF